MGFLANVTFFGKKHLTAGLTEIESLFDDLFGVTSSALPDFLFFEIFYLKHYCYLFIISSCLNENKSIV